MVTDRACLLPCGAAFLCLLQASASAAPECNAYGTPTYKASRTVEHKGRVQSGTVYIRGEAERDETTVNGKPVVHIRSKDRTVSYDPIAKKGIVVPAPSADRPTPTSDATTQVDRISDTSTHTLIVRKRIGDAWVQVYRSVCRSDGVLLEREFPVPIDGEMLLAKMRHTNIEVTDIPTKLLSVPQDVYLLPPPPPRKK